MIRNKWEFAYTATALADAAATKRDHHNGRLAWWKAKQEAVIAEVKEKGLEITESLSMEYATSSFHGMKGAQLTVKNDYQDKLNECHMKIKHHGDKAKEYDGWHQALNAKPSTTFCLDIDDYLFFFGV